MSADTTSETTSDAGTTAGPEVELKQVGPRRVARLEHEGPFDELPNVFNQLYGWMQQLGIRPDGAPFQLEYSDPAVTDPEECISEACIPVGPDVHGDDDVDILTLPVWDVLSSTHTGVLSYEHLVPIYDAMNEWAEEHGYNLRWPRITIYHKAPPEVPEEEMETEIRWVCRRKG